jgi:hypothetical protein
MNDGTASSSGLLGAFCEGIVYPSALNATQYGNLNTNLHSASSGWNF